MRKDWSLMRTRACGDPKWRDPLLRHGSGTDELMFIDVLCTPREINKYKLHGSMMFHVNLPGENKRQTIPAPPKGWLLDGT